MAEKTKRISIRVTPEEYDLIQQKMEIAGMKNMSLYMMKMALRGYVINLAVLYKKALTPTLRNSL